MNVQELENLLAKVKDKNLEVVIGDYINRPLESVAISKLVVDYPYDLENGIFPRCEDKKVLDLSSWKITNPEYIEKYEVEVIK